MKTDFTRRDFIRVIGGAGIAAATIPIVGGCSSTPQKALAPWEVVHTPQNDFRRTVLSYAILAPNPHNRQPWIVDLAEPNQITLYCDLTRLLPETDPYSRQILIGHGAFLELLSIAAKEFGYQANITPFPKGAFGNTKLDQRPVAQIELTKTTEKSKDPLFPHILNRRTNRQVFDTQQEIKGASLLELEKALPVSSTLRLVTRYQPQQLPVLRGLIWKGIEKEFHIPRTHMESVRLMRIGKKEIEQSPDGISLRGPMMEIGRMFGFLTREKLADPTSSMFQQGVEIQKELADSAMAFGWLISKDNSRVSQLEAGRGYARLNLKATQLGLAMQPWSQVLQEYPEMTDLQAEFFKQSGQTGKERTQMLFRMGYAPEQPPSPRWPIEKLLRT